MLNAEYLGMFVLAFINVNYLQGGKMNKKRY